jgi:hypothetical protein
MLPENNISEIPSKSFENGCFVFTTLKHMCMELL